MTTKSVTREVWLRNAAERLTPIIAGASGEKVPPVYLSVGFPKGARGKGRAIGQCWPGDLSADGTHHIFICPTLPDTGAVLPVLLHELIHATVGTAAKHRGPFAKTMKAAGMVKPWTTSSPGPELLTKLVSMAEALGPYPHATLSLPVRGSKGSRLRLWECECGVKVRVARDEFNATCDDCEQPFERQQ
jgi:hypothetical protein